MTKINFAWFVFWLLRKELMFKMKLKNSNKFWHSKRWTHVTAFSNGTHRHVALAASWCSEVKYKLPNENYIHQNCLRLPSWLNMGLDYRNNHSSFVDMAIILALSGETSMDVCTIEQELNTDSLQSTLRWSMQQFNSYTQRCSCTGQKTLVL